MLVTIPDLVTADELAEIQTALTGADWQDGRATAGEQAARVKHNRQIAAGTPLADRLGGIVLAALGRNPAFSSAALPLHVMPPMFNSHQGGEHFGAHVDGAIRIVPGTAMRLRTDVSATLFLSAPDSYDGGALMVEDRFGRHAIKLDAGHLALYPATSVHEVAPVTRGTRLACVFWVQSLVKDEGQRRALYELDQTIMDLRSRLADDDPAIVSLTAHYHNLVRRWSEL